MTDRAKTTGPAGRGAPPTGTPAVRAAARRLGVNLAGVTGTGVGGRVSMRDVNAAAPPRNAAPAGRTVEVRSMVNDLVTVTIDVYGTNPLVEDARQSVPAVYATAVRGGPPPTVFDSGDLPPFTASGVDPRELRRVPWYARHFCAATPEAGTVLRAIEQFAQDPADFFGQYTHDGAQEYHGRVHAWLMAGPSGINEEDAHPAPSTLLPYSGGYRRT